MLGDRDLSRSSRPRMGETQLSRVGVRYAPGISFDAPLFARSSDLAQDSLPTSSNPYLFQTQRKKKELIPSFFFCSGIGISASIARRRSLFRCRGLRKASPGCFTIARCVVSLLTADWLASTLFESLFDSQTNKKIHPNGCIFLLARG